MVWVMVVPTKAKKKREVNFFIMMQFVIFPDLQNARHYLITIDLRVQADEKVMFLF